MFDFRYHVVSLAAVFLALIVGILVGVGLSARGLIDEVERDTLNRQIAGLRAEVDSANRRLAEQEAAEVFVATAYPAVMRDRLRDRRIAVLFVGSADAQDGLRSSILSALSDAGATDVRVRAIDVPVDAEALSNIVAARPALAHLAGPDNVSEIGETLGEELVAGGTTPLWDALTTELVQEREGAGVEPADAVVVARTARPQHGETGRFVRGLYAGIEGSVPAVGVEVSRAPVSAIAAYRRAGLSSVDNVDGRVGRVSLAVLLAGGRDGHYGLKETADAFVPPIEPVEPELPARG